MKNSLKILIAAGVLLFGSELAALRAHPAWCANIDRGALALLLTARAIAVIAGRDYVTPEDVKTVGPAVLAHRITVRPELWMSNASGASVAADVLATVATPSAGGVPG